MERRFKEHGTKPSMHTLIHTHLLQLVGLGLVLVPVGIFPVGQAEGPHWDDAVDVVPHPCIWLLQAARKETRYWILSDMDRWDEPHHAGPVNVPNSDWTQPRSCSSSHKTSALLYLRADSSGFMESRQQFFQLLQTAQTEVSLSQCNDLLMQLCGLRLWHSISVHPNLIYGFEVYRWLDRLLSLNIVVIIEISGI